MQQQASAKHSDNALLQRRQHGLEDATDAGFAWVDEQGCA
jgi:hypothetical protein